MSNTSLRHHAFTFAFLPVRRVRRLESVVRTVRLRTSRRQFKRALRSVLSMG